MMTTEIDQDGLVRLFAEASARQGEALRQTVREATLGALQGRELSLQNVRSVLQAVTEASSAGAARNPAAAVDLEALLGKALAGMDDALITAVEAHHKALEQLVDQGMDFSETRLKSVLEEIDKMEAAFLSTVTGVAAGAGPLQAPWTKVLESTWMQGTGTGAHAAQTIEQLMGQARSALRNGRDEGLRGVQTLVDGYSTLVSGVLIGMVEGMRRQAPPAPPAPVPAAPTPIAAAAARRRKP